MSVRSNILLVFFLFLGSYCHSQNQKNIDSLTQILNTDISDKEKVDAYVQLATEYQSSDSLNTALYVNKAINLAKEIGYIEGSIEGLYPMAVNNVINGNFAEADSLFMKMSKNAKINNYKEGEAMALYGLGRLKAYLGQNGPGLKYLLESLKIREAKGETRSIALNYNMIGLVYMKKGNYGEALEHFFNALKINQKNNQLLQVGANYNNIGIIYKNQGEIDKAIEYYKESLEIGKQLNRQDVIASNYINIGNLYLINGDYNKALEYQLQALKINSELGDKREIAYCYDNIGQAYLQLKDYGKALNYFSEALTIFVGLESSSDRAHTLVYLGKTYNALNRPTLAKKYLQEGIGLAQEEGLLENLRDGVEELAKIEQKLGNNKNAYEAHVLFKQVSDSISNDKTANRITRLSAEYDFQKEKDSLELVQQQKLALLEEKRKRKENLRFAIALCILLAFVAGISVYLALNKIKRAKELDLLRNHISRDLHDEIGTTLSSLALFGTVASTSVKHDPAKATKLLHLINSNATASVEAMNDIVWAINSEKDSVFNLIYKMKSYVSEIRDTGMWDINIKSDSRITDIKLDMVQRRNVYLIFKEAVNNAVKYSKGNTITINIVSVKNLIQVEIKDNGVGFELKEALQKENELGGNGLKNMQKRAEELAANLEIKTQPKKGTKIILSFNPKHLPKIL